MKECTETDKPLISIVMATYNPRLDWLREQLVSLDEQSYENLELLIIDDCSTAVTFDIILGCVKECITRIPVEIHRNERNLGSTKTFEKLTMLARGEYIAFCDQDDIWSREKIATLSGYFLKTSVMIAYSDVEVIDGEGCKKAGSISTYRRRHKLYSGSGLSSRLLVQNFVIGCTMMIRKEIAQQAVPFIPNMVHDHYLALIASIEGEIALCKEPLVYYRVHACNQTNTLSRVRSREDYYTFKIKDYIKILEQLELKGINKKISEFNSIKKWAVAREAYYQKKYRNAVTIWKYRNLDFGVSMFELLLVLMPNQVFSYFLRKIKKEDN